MFTSYYEKDIFPDSLHFSHGVAVNHFSGCIKDVKFMRSDDFTINSVDILAEATESAGVSTQYCYEQVKRNIVNILLIEKVGTSCILIIQRNNLFFLQVTPGIGFTNVDSYARLANSRMAISVVQLSFQTYEPSGILVYGQRPEGIVSLLNEYNL